MAVSDKARFEEEYEYTIEFDDGTNHPHYYFAHSVDATNPSFLKFDPLYELGQDVARQIEGETYLIPYLRIVRVVRRKDSD